MINSASLNESWRETLETVNERKPQMWSFFFPVSHLSIGWSGFDFWTKSQSCTSAFWIETEENHSLLSNDIQAFNFFPEKQIFPVIDTKSKKAVSAWKLDQTSTDWFHFKSFFSLLLLQIYNFSLQSQSWQRGFWMHIPVFEWKSSDFYRSCHVIHPLFHFNFFCLSSHSPSCMHIFVWF